MGFFASLFAALIGSAFNTASYLVGAMAAVSTVAAVYNCFTNPTPTSNYDYNPYIQYQNFPAYVRWNSSSRPRRGAVLSAAVLHGQLAEY